MSTHNLSSSQPKKINARPDFNQQHDDFFLIRSEVPFRTNQSGYVYLGLLAVLLDGGGYLLYWYVYELDGVGGEGELVFGVGRTIYEIRR